MKYCGNIGFAETSENPVDSGIWTENIIERKYYGDVVRVSRRLHQADKVNDDLDVSNELSIIADAFASQNFHAIRYAVWMGSKWKVTNVTVESPRLTLSLGGLYHD